MFLKYLISGFFVKLIAGFDDAMVHIPIVANITRTKKGRIAFSLGILFAIILAIIISFLFASIIKTLPYFKYISAALIFLLALLIYFDVFISKPKRKIEKKLKTISSKRFFKLLVIGFFTGFTTIIDDIIIYSSLFLGNILTIPYVVAGIFSATLLQLTAVIYFSKKVMKFKYKKEITTIGLIVLSLLILFNIL